MVYCTAECWTFWHRFKQFIPEEQGELYVSIAVHSKTIKEIIETIEPLRDNEPDDMSPSSSCNKDTFIKDKSDKEDKKISIRWTMHKSTRYGMTCLKTSFRDNGWRQFEQQRKSTKFTDRDSVIKDNSVNESDINIQFQSGDKVNNEGYRLSDPDIETAKKIQLPMKYKMTNFISATRKKETVIEDESDINASQSDYVPSCCENKNKLTDMHHIWLFLGELENRLFSIVDIMFKICHVNLKKSWWFQKFSSANSCLSLIYVIICRHFYFLLQLENSGCLQSH